MVGSGVGVAGGFLYVAQRDAGVERGGDERVPQGVGTDLLVQSGPASDPAHDTRRAVAVHALAVGAQENRSVEAFSDGQGDGACSTWCQGGGDNLSAVAQHGQGAVAAFDAKFVDVRAECFGDPQPVDREQGDRGVFGRCAGSGSDEQRSDLVAVRTDGVRVVIQSWSAHVGSRRGFEQVFLDGVAVQPGDGAQPAGDARAGTTSGFHVPCETFDVGALRGEQMQPVLRAPRRVLAQVEGVRVAGQSGVAG
jgi:hypothetical protein